MKLIAYTIDAVVVSDEQQIKIHRPGSSKILSAETTSRLRDVGFRLVDEEVSSIEEAFKIASEKIMKDPYGYYKE